MVQFLSINFLLLQFFNFCWGFKSSRFFCVTLYLAKITHLVKSGFVELVQDCVSDMAAYCDL